MKLVDCYKRPEGMAARHFSWCYLASLMYLFVVTIILRSFDDPCDLPDVLWHILNISIYIMFVSLCVASLWMLLVWPAWELLRKGEHAAKSSFSAGVKPFQFALVLTIVTGIFTVPTILVIAEHDTVDKPECFDTYAEFDDNGFGSFMLPEGSSDIKRYYDCGFGYQICDISCKVSLERLNEFAVLHAYRFEKCDNFPLPAKSCVMRELYPIDKGTSRYLYCQARKNKKSACGWEMEGNLIFVYDSKTERLFASYDD